METEGRQVARLWGWRAVIRALAPPEERAGILSDLDEEAAEIAARDGRRAAARFIRWQAVHSALPWLGRRGRESAARISRSITMGYRGLWSDVRLAARRMIKSRGFTALAVATLAIGIGAVSTAFSLAHALWLKPLPYHEPQRLVWIQARHLSSGASASLTAVELAEHQRASRSLTGVAGYSYGAGIARVNGEPVRIVSHHVTPNLFRVLGVRPALGRDFIDADAATGSHILMLTDRSWTIRFGRDPAVVGKTMTMNGMSYQIAGVMPREFTFPRGLEAEVFLPEDLTAGGDASRRVLQAVGRLAPGFTVADAAAEAEVRARGLAQALPASNAEWTSAVASAAVTASRASQLGFQILLGIVSLFLLIACTNLAGLLLARHASRRTELAVCLSIGASRWRLARMLLVESALLAVSGCAAGVLLAAYGARALSALLPPRTPGLDNIGLSVPVLAVAVAVSCAAAALVGVLPALMLRSLKPSEALAGARTVVRGAARAQRSLVVAEIALAVILVVGAASMLRSFATLLNRDRGYDPRGLLALNVSLPFTDDSYLPTARRARAFSDLLARVAAVPGVVSAAATTGFPGSPLGILGGTPIAVEGRAPVMAAVHAATEDYFKTMRIPVLAGRAFTPADATEAPAVAIVNATLAREFPGGNPVGRQIPVTIFGETRQVEIVGVTGDIRLTSHVGQRLFVPLAQASPYWIDLVLRSEQGAALMPVVRQVLRSANGDLLLENESSFQRIISDSLGLERAESAFAGLVGALAAMVAGIGIYALMTFVAAQRRREMGIRLALGAQPGQLFRASLFAALRLVAAGLTVGLVAAIALVRALGSQVFGLTSADAGVYVAAAALVLAVSTAAVWMPARRAMRTDPLIALRLD